MRRIALVTVCVFGMMGCEELAQWWQEHGSAGGAGAAAPPSIQHTTQLDIFEDGRAALLADQQGLALYDLRDPERPTLLSVYTLESEGNSFYRVGQHVLLVARGVHGYGGVRTDLNVVRGGDALLNIDISDRAHPTLIETIYPGSLGATLLRRGPDGDSLFVAATQLTRYDLRAGKLVESATLALAADAAQLDGTPDVLVAAISSDPDNTMFGVEAVDISGPGLGAASFSFTLTGAVNRAKLILDGDKLHVGASTVLSTFDLQQPLTTGPSGSCTLDYDVFSGWWLQPGPGWLFSSEEQALYYAPAGLFKAQLKPDGSCPERTSYGQTSTAVVQLEASAGDNRVLALGPNALSLYDTAAAPAMVATPLASAPLAAQYGDSRYAANILQRIELPSADGTLFGATYYNDEPLGRYQLFALAGDKLSAKAQITDPGLPIAVAHVGSALATISSAQLRLFDVSDLSAPHELGHAPRPEAYGQSFDFGDYRVRDTLSPWPQLPHYARLQVFRASDMLQPVVDFPVVMAERPQNYVAWLQAGELLIYANMDQDWALHTELQLYDFKDPLQPRAAGHLVSEEVGVNWTTESHTPMPSQTLLTVDNALLSIYWRGQDKIGTYAFDVIDLRDPDHPTLLRPAFKLPGDNFVANQYRQQGSQLYVTELSGSKLYGSIVDFSDLDAPTQSTRREVPGAIVGVNADKVFTQTIANQYTATQSFTLSQLQWGEQTAPLTAARTWAKRIYVGMATRGELIYLIHRPLAEYLDPPPPDADSSTRWDTLEIVDVNTLATLSTLQLDLNTYDGGPTLSGDILLVTKERAQLQVDVSDPRQPRVTGAFFPAR